MGNMQKIFTVIFNVEFILGYLINGFIALVNLIDLVKKRKLSSADGILTALAVSRIGQLSFASLDWWVFVQYPALWPTSKMLKMIGIIWTVVSHCSIWLATSLSIFYFLNIANFPNSIFLYLKWRVKKVVSLTLLVSLVLLFLNILIVNASIDVMVDGYKRNLSDSSSDYMQFSNLLQFSNTMILFLPFIVSLTTCLLLIFSLWKHLKRMQHSAGGSRDISTTAHIKALQTVMVSVLLYAIYFLSLWVKIWNTRLLMKNLILLLCQTAANAFLSCHTCVLILGNSKLRQACLSVLRWLGNGSSGAEPLGP